MSTDKLFILLLVVLLPLTGCLDTIEPASADDAHGDDADNEPQWVNGVGTNLINWNLTLNDNQWLEVKSAVGLLIIGDENSSQQETVQYGMTVSELTGWTVTSTGFSPIFGGTYSICGMMMDENCYASDPDGGWTITQWSVIYRIHSV